jgi:hypothetical protein
LLVAGMPEMMGSPEPARASCRRRRCCSSSTFPLACALESAGADELCDAMQLVHVEPGSMFTTDVHDNPELWAKFTRFISS